MQPFVTKRKSHLWLSKELLLEMFISYFKTSGPLLADHEFFKSKFLLLFNQSSLLGITHVRSTSVAN